MSDLTHSIIEILGVTIPIILDMAANRYSARKEMMARHVQNSKKN